VFSLTHPPPPLLKVVEEEWEHGCVGDERGGWTSLGALRIHVGFEQGFLEYIYTK
jgi:hypothetical protein